MQIVDLRTKYCKECDQVLPASEFYSNGPNSKKPGALAAYCKTCQAIVKARSRLKNLEDSREKDKRVRDNIPWYRKLWRTSKTAAKLASREHNITEDFINSLYEKQNGKCFWLNVPLILDSKVNRHFQKPSLDRLDCSLGYTEDNVVLASTFANLGRTDNTVDDFNTFIDVLKQTMINSE